MLQKQTLYANTETQLREISTKIVKFLQDKNTFPLTRNSINLKSLQLEINNLKKQKKDLDANVQQLMLKRQEQKRNRE